MEKVKKHVVVAYSGGIDSNAAIGILQNEGYEVTALTLSLTHGDEEAIESARLAAKKIGVEFVAIDCRDRFRELIIKNFTEEYIAGRTPAPCTRCNPLIKWHILTNYAKEIGASHIATGHYFSISSHNGKLYVARGADPRKDQSYYLWGVSQESLSMALTPMADKIKEVIKSKSHIKKESMGVCFLRGRHYTEILQEGGVQIVGGDIVDFTGYVVGRHKGLAYYTVGQKRGEGIPSGLAVIGIDSAKNQIIVGTDELLYARTITIDKCNIIDEEEWLTSPDITILVRGLGRNPEGYVRVEKSEIEGQYILHLDDPAWACAAGQPVVLYRSERVIGGGYLIEAY